MPGKTVTIILIGLLLMIYPSIASDVLKSFPNAGQVLVIVFCGIFISILRMGQSCHKIEKNNTDKSDIRSE
jgi:hypothetical protein